MKKVFYILALSIIVINVNLYSQNDYMKNRFSIGVYNWVMNEFYRSTQHLQNYNNLHLNVNFSFTYRGDNNPSASMYDGFLIPSSNYTGTFSSTINNLFNSQTLDNKQKVYFERAKVLRPASGQRSTYEVEEHGSYNNKYPGYGYQSSETGTDYYNDLNLGINGRKCAVGENSAGFIVKDLYENMEQINKLETDISKTDMKYFWSDNKEPDYFWVVKPRMRIKVSDFNDPFKKELPVVIIEVNRFDGTKISVDEQFTIKVKDFAGLTGNYYGDYIENYYEINPITQEYLPKIKIYATDLVAGIPPNPILANSQVDYRVYWSGNVDVWLDYVRMDDKWAHYLFTDPAGTASGNELLKFHQKIAEEVSALSNTNGFGYFYLDEYAYNNYPCIAEVNRIIQSINPNTGLVAMNNEIPSFCHGGADELRNKPFSVFYDTLYNSKAVTDVFISETYPFIGGLSPEYNGVALIPSVFNIPDVLPPKVMKFYHKADNDEQYNFSINGSYEKNLFAEIPSNIYNYSNIGNLRRSAKLIKKAKTDGKDITVSMAIQTHSFETTYMNDGTSGLREPTNQEISMQSYLAMIYGAKQIMDFSYNSETQYGNEENTDVYKYHNYGLLDENNTGPRYTNYYGQPKWDFVCNLNAKLRQIGNILYPVDQPLQHLIYDASRTINTNFQDEHPDYGYGLPFKFILDINSIYLNPFGVFEDINVDEPSVRYWEAGFFNPPVSNSSEKYSMYFIMLNKRCTPPVAGVTAGDVRTLKMKFKPDELPGFNNWVVTDPLTNTIVATINKNSIEYYSLGVFQPGEGKLFKIAPVMQEGGTFVCDEQVINKSFECKAPVHTGGYKLELLSQNSGQTTVTFKPDAQIVGEIGNEIWIWGTNNNHVRLIGNNWLGIYAADLECLNMEFVDIENVSAAWAVSAYNCYDTKIDYCVLNLVENKRAINVNNTNVPDAEIEVYNNIINLSNSLYAVFFGGSAGSSNTLYFCDNTITSSTQSQVGVLLSNIISSYVSGNHISGFNNGLKLLNCGLDLTSNTIENSGDNSVGIDCYSLSTINMGLNGSYLAGHDNKIISHGSQCKNISLDNSTFQMDYGSNNLQVDIGSGSYNMYGFGDFIINDDGPELFIEAKNNCFNLNGNMAIHHITDPNGYLFGLHEIPHNCLKPRDLIVDFVQPLTESLVDTVYRTTDSSYQNLSVTKTLYQNFYLNMIKKNYDSTIIIGFNLLSNFADSTNSTDIISKLYYSTSRIDSTGQNVTSLKTFLEQLILNNTQNVMLVKSANYYIQKCKVQLKQYTSALDGFQDIMVQNPYSYDGVLASWDYAATLLLANSSGGYSNKVSEYTESNGLNAENEYSIDTLRINKFARNDKYDKKVFTTEDRKQLFKSVGNVLKDERSKQIEKVKTLEEKLTKADLKEKSKLQIQITEAKNINSVVKVKRPKDDYEYQAIVNNDIEKLNPKKETGNSGINNLIPTTYALYQNYPNPFNPTTKIAFDLPKDAKVKLVIYDILGREMKTLVNNEFRTTGKYITEFNGSSLASGIYFARILVNDGKDFISVKKMVLIK